MAAARTVKASVSTARATMAAHSVTEKTMTPVVCTGGTWDPICSLAVAQTCSSAR